MYCQDLDPEMKLLRTSSFCHIGALTHSIEVMVSMNSITSTISGTFREVRRLLRAALGELDYAFIRGVVEYGKHLFARYIIRAQALADPELS